MLPAQCIAVGHSITEWNPLHVRQPCQPLPRMIARVELGVRVERRRSVVRRPRVFGESASFFVTEYEPSSCQRLDIRSSARARAVVRLVRSRIGNEDGALEITARK